MPSIYDNQQQKYLQQAQQAAKNALMQGANKETAGFVPANTSQPAQQTTPSQSAAAPAATAAAGTYTGYSPSQAVLAAQQYLNQQLANKPGAYVSKYDAQLDALLSEMMNRGPFTYDANADPLYNIYKDLYIQNGRRAMQDTLGNAAALTGGYGSSYGQSAAQQMYNQYMEGLNSVVPQLQQQAYQRYSDEGDRMAQNFQFMNALENQNYGRYRDTVSDWQMDRNYAYQAALNAEQMDRQQYQYDTTFRENQRQYDLSLAEQQRQADLNEAYRQAQLAEQIRQADLDEAYRQQQAAEAVRQYNQNFGYQQQQDALAEAYRQAQLAENQRQFNMNFGEEGRQYDANLAEKIREFDLSHGLDQAQFDFNVRKYEEALAQASGGGNGGNGGNDSNKNKDKDKQTQIPLMVDAGKLYNASGEYVANAQAYTDEEKYAAALLHNALAPNPFANPIVAPPTTTPTIKNTDNPNKKNIKHSEKDKNKDELHAILGF